VVSVVVGALVIVVLSQVGLDVYVERGPPADTYVQQLIKDHHCWTGEAPADVIIPGGVLIRDGTGTVTFSDAGGVVGAALDDVFGTDNPRFSVVAFCR
jgi:hypothetical protein